MNVSTSAKPDLDRIRGHFSSENDECPWCWLFYGDSITHGAKHTHGWRSFPEIFAERVRWELRRRQDIVINAGYSGNTTDDLLKEYDWRCRHWHPDAVFLLIGINDIVKLDNRELFRSNLIRLTRQFRADGAIPVLQTCSTIQKHPENPGYWKRYQELPAYNEMIRETAREEEVILIDHDRHWREKASDPEILASWLGERIHPGALGHLEMAKEIFRSLDIFDPDSDCCNPRGTFWSVPPVFE